MKDAIRLAVTLGDPRGIGPEVAAAAAEQLRDEPDRPELVFIGPEGTGAEDIADEFRSVGPWNPGESRARAGLLAGRAIEKGATLALGRAVDGLVTAPIDKAALQEGGYPFPGHTEFLAELSGNHPVVMMMQAERTLAGGPLRIVLATTHIPLSKVPGALSVDLLTERSRVAGTALRRLWGMADPVLALCAVNPHASDGGIFGDEEERLLVPAREDLRSDGWRVEGPIPADTVFTRAIRGEYDVVIVPYHDVGMAAFKTVSFGRGVNVTLGLPFVRTSPDHGTALDIAGKGMADPTSMVEAIRLATRLAGRESREPAAS